MARDRRPFRPWRRDLVLCGLCAVVALIALWHGFTIGSHEALVVAAVVALVLAWGARRLWRRAGSRQFGVQLEHGALARIGPLLDSQGLRWRKNLPVAGLGDVDLVVYTRRGPVVVEIKSFRRWRQFLFFAGARERAALAQAARGRKALKAHRGLVWLPQGRATWLQRTFGAGGRGVRVVFGSGQCLLHSLT